MAATKKTEQDLHVLGHGETNPGQVRENNEDSFLSLASFGLFIVADGMGGHNGGEIASQNAVSIVREQLEAQSEWIASLHRESPESDWTHLKTLLESAVNAASARIHKMAAEDPGLQGMGTTLTLVLVMKDRGLMAHVGDSRLYLCRAQQVYQLSEDHTYVWQMLQKGKMTAEEAHLSPFSHLLTRAVGMQPQVEVDLLYFEILPGDTFLLSSDGLHDYILRPSESLLPALTQDDLGQGATALIDWANTQGGKDNITCVLFRIFGEAEDHHEQVTLQYTALQKTTIFRYITYEEMLRVLNVIEVEEASAGHMLMVEGEEGREIFVILSGEVEVTREGKVLRHLGPGAHFGEMALINSAPRSASIQTLTRYRLMVISETGLYSLMRNEPRVANKMLWGLVEVLSSRLRQNSDILANLLSKKAASK